MCMNSQHLNLDLNAVDRPYRKTLSMATFNNVALDITKRLYTGNNDSLCH